jgi:hypothetical protein
MGFRGEVTACGIVQRIVLQNGVGRRGRGLTEMVRIVKALTFGLGSVYKKLMAGDSEQKAG